jgi:hypothetical protein
MPESVRAMLENSSDVEYNEVETLLGTSARLLLHQNFREAASLLANARCKFEDRYDDGGNSWYQHLTLFLPVEVFANIENEDTLIRAIQNALDTCSRGGDKFSSIGVRLVPRSLEVADWRSQIRRMLNGEGVTNQGRARSDSIAPIEHAGLLFRSPPEVEFFKALLQTGVPFAPLSVVVAGGDRRRRIEPDFVIYHQGQVMVVEIDGRFTHRESPTEAHKRLKFLKDEGCLEERIETDECDTPAKASDAVKRILATMTRRRRLG